MISFFFVFCFFFFFFNDTATTEIYTLSLHDALPTSPEAVDAVVVALVDRVTRRMRASGRAGRTVVLRLRFGDFSRGTRSQTLSRATAATRTVLAAARELLAASRTTIDRRGLTLVG